MATPKKKHLIELMIEAGVKWPDGAKYAAQDNRDLYVWFYSEKPKFAGANKGKWTSDVNYENGRKCRIVDGEKLNEICSNWHQTIVTREQYAEAVALATNVSEPVVDAVEWHNPPSIEQLTSDYHAKAAEAARLQAVADEALKAADDALLALEKAGELLGLVISIYTKPKHVEQPVEPAQPIITDWRDLRVGDVIWVGEPINAQNAPSGEYSITDTDFGDKNQPVEVEWLDVKTWPDLTVRQWRFIRRP